MLGRGVVEMNGRNKEGRESRGPMKESGAELLHVLIPGWSLHNHDYLLII